MRRLLWLPVAAAVGVLVATAPVISQPPGEFGVLQTTPASPAEAPAPATAPRMLPAGVEPIQQASAPAANPFPLTPDAGPWLICAATYIGPDGAELSRQLAVELRSKHRLSACILNRGDEERRRQQQEWEELQRRSQGTSVRRRGYRIQDQYAVVIGGFKDFAAASAYLPAVKKLPLPELKLDDKKSPFDLMTYQETDPDTKKVVVKQAPVNPFHSAMVVRNPLAPSNQTARPKWDPFWKQLNANEEFSLLKNPKAYTLVVKEYMGARTVQQHSSGGFLSALGLGGAKPGEALDAAAQQAHELARFLSGQGLGYKAYVLHTRYSSVVSVGGFDSPEDPDLQRAVQQMSSLRFTPKGGGADPVGLLPNPVPVEVPRP